MNMLIEDVDAGIVENGISAGVQTMALDKVFWSHFCTNLAPATWILGALLVGIGLDFRTGLLAIVVGNVLGCLPVGLNATIGPRTGLTQIEISRFSFGRFGTRVPSVLNWFCAVGWDAVNNVPSVLALVALAALFGIGLAFWIGLALLVAVQLAASMYGHHVVQLIAKYLCYILIVVFTITGVVAIMKGGSLAAAHAAIRPATFVLGVSMIAGFAIGFAPYASDYTRYLPRETNPRTVFLLAFCGLGISSSAIEFFGLLTASHLTDLSPAGVIAEIGALTGPFAPVALFAIAASAISINSINDNTAAYSLISSGVRIPRHIAAIITTACGFALAVAGAGKFAEYFSNYLLLLLYWIAPWAGIVITDWLLFRGEVRAVRGWGSGATIFAIVTPVTIALFSATEIYTGPLAKLLGGTDIGFFVGFCVASLCYAYVERRRRAASPAAGTTRGFRHAMFALVATALALGATRVPAASAQFTLDSVLAAPFADDLVASPKGDALAWTVHERGRRNVVVWKAGTTRQLTHDTADDGFALGGLSFLPDASAVVYTRGSSDGDTNNANPTGPAQRSARKLFLTSLSGGATIELGDGRSAAVSPRGDRIAWIGTDGAPSTTGQVMSAQIATHDGGRTYVVQKPTPLFTVRGSADAPLWSPDGSRIAITNKRGDHTYIAIYTLGSRIVTYALPTFSNDRSPVWSPDGSQIAFVRLPGDVSTLGFYDDPSLYAPWSIVVANAATGEGRVVWRAARGRGNEFSVADDVQPLWWSQSGRLAFVWERDGWRHLYSLPASGGTATLLTPGSFEIEQIALARSGEDLLYTSNEGDLDARHVWRVPFAGGERERVTGGATNQWSPLQLANGSYAYMDASYNVPGTVTLAPSRTIDANANTDAAASTALVAKPPPSGYPVTSLVQPEPIVFKAPDGLAIHRQLFLARDGRAKHPAVIFVHGGPERQMLTTYHYYEPYTNLYELNQYLVSRGFDVLSVNYRSGIMFGHDFFEAPRRGWLGASEYQDVLAGARVLGARSDVDPKRVGIYGLSYGGYLTALALARNSDVFAAGVDQAGVHDWPSIIDTFSGGALGTPAQRAVALAASPIGDLSKWTSPVLLDQGDDDRDVPFSQSVTLANLLEARGVDVTLHATPDELHEYAVYAHELDRFQRTADFLATHLGAH